MSVIRLDIKANNMNVYQALSSMHSYLMYKKFPYHSVSVIHRGQDLGFHVIFMDNVREIVTDEIKSHIEAVGFTYSYAK